MGQIQWIASLGATQTYFMIALNIHTLWLHLIILWLHLIFCLIPMNRSHFCKRVPMYLGKHLVCHTTSSNSSTNYSYCSFRIWAASVLSSCGNVNSARWTYQMIKYDLDIGKNIWQPKKFAAISHCPFQVSSFLTTDFGFKNFSWLGRTNMIKHSLHCFCGFLTLFVLSVCSLVTR